MLISYGLPKARCPCSNGQNKTAEIRVPPKGPVGLFQQKAERNQNKISMVVPRGGLARASSSNGLECQTAARDRFDPQRQFGALSNPSCSPTQMSSERGRKKSEINPRKHCE